MSTANNNTTKSFIEQLNDKFTEQELINQESISLEIVQDNNIHTDMSIDNFITKKIENIVNNIVNQKLKELNNNIDSIISNKLITHKHEIDNIVRESIKKIFNTV